MFEYRYTPRLIALNSSPFQSHTEKRHGRIHQSPVEPSPCRQGAPVCLRPALAEWLRQIREARQVKGHCKTQCKSNILCTRL